MSERIRKKFNLKLSLAYVVVIIILIFTLFPVFWIASTSFKPEKEFYSIPVVFISSHPVIEHYSIVLAKIPKPLVNSLVISLSSVAIAMAIGIPAAYGITRFRVGGKNLLFWILSIRMFPPIVAAIPIYILWAQARLLDTRTGLIIVYVMFNLPFVVWMMRGFFLEIPVELEESAMIDGCSQMGALIRIVLPLSAPGLIATTTFAEIFVWSEFLFALVLTGLNTVTLPVEIAKFFGHMGGKGILWGVMSGMSILAVLPIVVLFFILQRYVIRGLTMGALK